MCAARQVSKRGGVSIVQYLVVTTRSSSSESLKVEKGVHRRRRARAASATAATAATEETTTKTTTSAVGPATSSYRALGSRRAMRLARHRYVHSAYAMNATETAASAAPPRKEARVREDARGARDGPLIEAFRAFGAGDELGSDNQGAEEMLQRLPGITAHNYRRVMRGVSCLADLCTMDEAQLVQLLGNSTDAKRLYRFLNQPAPV